MGGWQRKKISIDEEKQIITGMIVSTSYLKEIRSILKPNLLQVPFVKIIANWCLDYYDVYKKAPEGTIQEIYETHIRNSTIEDIQSDMISEFLIKLSEDYVHNPNFNVKYYLDQAEDYLKRRSLEALSEDIKSAIEKKDNLLAENLIANFKKITRQSINCIDVLKNTDAIISAIDKREEKELFQLHGDLGKAIGPLSRSNLLVISAPAKRGKSTLLSHIAITALLQELKVLWFSFEMDENEIIQLIYKDFLGETLTPSTIKIPIFDCEKNQNGECDSSRRVNTYDITNELYKPCTVCRNVSKQYQIAIWQKTVNKEGITSEKAVKKANEIAQLARRGKLKLACYPANSMTPEDMDLYLDNLEYYDNFIPDVIVIDYAKIMRCDERLEFRHKIDYIWQGIRSIGQKRHICMISADHSNTSTFNKRIVQGTQAEDNRVLNHVTHMIALNQTDEEKDKGIMKINMLVGRFCNFNQSKDIIVLECKDIGRAYLDSMYA